VALVDDHNSYDRLLVQAKMNDSNDSSMALIGGKAASGRDAAQATMIKFYCIN